MRSARVVLFATSALLVTTSWYIFQYLRVTSATFTLLYHRDVIHGNSEKPIYHMWYIGQYVTCGILANMSHVVYWHNIKSIYHMWYIGQYVTCGILVFQKFFPNAQWVLSEGRNKNFIMQINPCEQKSFYEKNRFVSQKSPKTSFSRPNTVIYMGNYFNCGYVVMTAL